ncbi:MAG: hypothetical protein M1832_002199 [Thelocarpon impressellum]|nr:MAG: hypothetical protein M1832_002199 [Thelocarpon impressellum]
MLGRDLTVERGTPSFSSGNDDVQGELQGQATRCVRRFAPNGCTKMKRTDNNHITACKISDANPNEMVVSWSGDWIYSFDLVRSPGAGEQDGKTGDQLTARAKAKAKESRDRKRKRGKASSKSPGISRGGSKPRQTLGDTGGDGELALRKRSRRIASAVVNLRKEFFALATSRSARDASTTTPGPTEHTSSFSGALGYAATYMQSVDDIMRTWRYPVNPGEEEVIFQQTLRRNRESTRQFLQAAGTIARILGGQMRTGGQGESPAMEYFRQILPAPNEGAHLAATVVFNYDFARAIAAWLDGGRDGLVHCFTQTPDRRRTSQRFPIPEAAGRGAIDEHLIPYLLRLASGRSIPNVDASPFERDEYQVAFETETAAVIAFGNAVKIPFEETAFEEASSSTSTQQRGAALRFWGLKVARGLLMNAAEGVNFGFVDRAFGGLGTNSEEESRGWNIEMGDTALENPTVSEPAESGRSVGPSVTGEEANSDEEMILLDDIHNEIADRLDFGSDDGAGDEGEDEESDDDDDGDITAEERHFMWASALDRSKMRERVESGVPCSSHTRRYSGHCNIRTVKDVNFFGLNDEYVVSGSDSGHVFIWDKKTSELINILEGDGEVVNVVQGHPYEPMLAVSGIDHTIKIFSPDQRAQADARKGIGITPQPSSGNSSLGHGGRAHPSARSDRPIDPLRNATLAGDDDEEGAEAVAPDGLQSRKQMHRSYEIISQNDVERQGGMRDAYITVRSPLLGVERVGIDFFEWLGMFD